MTQGSRWVVYINRRPCPTQEAHYPAGTRGDIQAVTDSESAVPLSDSRAARARVTGAAAGPGRTLGRRPRVLEAAAAATTEPAGVQTL